MPTTLITGASSGIGHATALLLASRGHAVALLARRRERLESLVHDITTAGGRAIAIAADVIDRNRVRAAIEQTISTFGSLDVLINNAGVMPVAPMAKCRFDDWDAMLDTNLRGPLNAIGCALPHMLAQKTGHIINISSVAGRVIFPGAAVYCGTKHALHAISDGLRGELAAQSESDGNTIRVTIIAPGVVITELASSITDQAARAAAEKYYATLKNPLAAEDVAQSILYAIEAPPHVSVSEILLRPTAQLR